MYHAARETRWRAARMDTLNVDVAIVGAGPAGSRAAFCLARAGARVALIDGSHPREKPCGGGVTGRALALVADAVDAARASLAPHPRGAVRGCVRAAAPSRFRSTATRSSSPAARNSTACCWTRRAARARSSWRRAPSTSRARRTASSSTPARGRVAARRLIGADGANSLVRRRLARPFARADLSIATGYFAHGADRAMTSSSSWRPIRRATSGRSRGPAIWPWGFALRPMRAPRPATCGPGPHAGSIGWRWPTARGSSRTRGRFPRCRPPASGR